MGEAQNSKMAEAQNSKTAEPQNHKPRRGTAPGNNELGRRKLPEDVQMAAGIDMPADIDRTPGQGAPGGQHDLVELLHSRGQRVTSQRLVILRELRRRSQHATAEEVHRAVQHELPGVSVPTIYATLDLFVELGLARRIETGTAALYDAGLEPHQHAVCRRCGRVEDVDGGIDADTLLGAARASGFHPQGAELIITGLCADCAAQAASAA